METLALQQVVDYAGGRLRQGDPSSTVMAINTDTRSISRGELFLALKGENFDGHRYILSAAAAGAVGAVVDRGFEAVGLPLTFALVEVENTLAAYHRLAASYRRALPVKVVAITGSNGKTSTKDLTAAILGRGFRVLKTEGNFNNHIGVPRTLLRLDRCHEVAVLEMGMNHPGEIAPLALMASPDIAIITNVGTAHLEFMKSREAIAREKGMLAEAVKEDGVVILNATDPMTLSIAARTSARVVAVGRKSDAVHAEAITQHIHGSQFKLIAGEESANVRLPVLGLHMITNSLLAVGAGLTMGLTLSECVAGLTSVRLSKGRLEMKNLGGRVILDDSYNANPDSMEAALETLAAFPATGRRIAVLGKMGELGSASESGHRSVGEFAAQKGIDYLITVGDEAETIGRAAQKAGAKNTLFFGDTEAAADWLSEESRCGDLILIKGSRSAAMECILPTLAHRLETSGKAVLGTRTVELAP